MLSASLGLIDLACVEGDPDIIVDENNDVLLEKVVAPRLLLDCCSCCCNVIGEKAKEDDDAVIIDATVDIIMPLILSLCCCSIAYSNTLYHTYLSFFSSLLSVIRIPYLFWGHVGYHAYDTTYSKQNKIFGMQCNIP